MRLLGEAHHLRKIHDTPFLKAVIDDGGHISKLEGDYNATHVYWMGGVLGPSTQVMPLKFVKEPDNGFFWVKYFRGVYVCWGVFDAIVFHSTVTTASRIDRKALLRKYRQVICEFKNMNNELAKLFPDNRQVYSDVVKATKHRELSRDERVQRYLRNDYVIEKDSYELLHALLGDSLRATPEKCLADCAFVPSVETTDTLQIQLKSSSNALFCSTAGYDGLLLICRSIKYADLGWLCIPGKGLPNNVELSPKGKYGKYLVPSDGVRDFMIGLYGAKARNETYFNWPRGESVDVTSLQLLSFDQISIPRNAADIVEYEARIWRKQILPTLEYNEPRFQGSTVDIIINGVTVQDKTTKADPQSQRYYVSLHKHIGLDRGKRSHGPYSETDFQALCILTQDRRYIFFIPTEVLCAKGYVTKGDSLGKTALQCYSSDYVRPTTGRRPDTWTQQYCHKADDPELETKFEAALYDIAEHYRTQA